MKTNMNKLKAKIVEVGITQEAVARMIDIDRSTFLRKVKGEGMSFTIGELHKMMKAIPLSKNEAIDIFLDE